MNVNNKQYPGFSIENSYDNFDNHINKSYISEDLQRKLRNVDILIIPQEGYSNYDIPLFPEGTEDLLNYIKNKLPPNYQINICIDDKNYKELGLYSDLCNLGTFVITTIVFPILINILYDYIKEIVIKSNKSKIKITATVIDKNNNSKMITYEGSAEDFIKIKEFLKKDK